MDSKYWLGRYLAIKKAQLSKAKRYEDDYRKRMAETQKAIEAEMDSWIARYAKEDGTLDPLEAKKLLRGKDLKEWKYTLAEWEAMAKEGGYEKEMNLEYYKSRVSRLKELEGQLAIIMTKPTRKEMTAFEDMLTNTHKETYLKTLFTRQMQTSNISKAFNRLDPNTVQALVRNGWQGSNFSERIWQNSTQKLPKLLTESLFSGMVLGQSKDEIQQTLKQRLKGFTDNDIHRLVITESAYITEQATDLAYDETGVDKIEWIAALEIHTCDTPIEVDGKTYKGCRGLDGQVFTRSRKFLLPPAHPFCRCTTAPWDEILDEIEFSRWSRDPATGKSVDTHAVKFDEWQEMVGLKPQSANKESEFVVAKLGEHLTKAETGSKTTYNGSLDKTNMKKMVGKDNYDNFVEHLNSIDNERVKQMFNLLGDKISFKPISNAHPHARGSNIQLDITSFVGDQYHYPMKTVYHEAGHAFDSLGMELLTGKNGFAVGKKKIKALGKMVEVDDNVYHASGLPDYKLKESFNRDLWRAINGSDLPMFEDLGTKPRKRAEKREWEDKRSEIYAALQKNTQKFQTEYKDKFKENPSMYVALSDMMESTGWFYGTLGAGHGKDYWKKTGMAETEFFAHATEMVASKEAEKVMREIFPTGINAWEKLVDDMLERVK